MDKSELLKAMADGLEPRRPSSQELHPIAPGKSWATIGFNSDDFSTKPVLFAHLKKLPPDFDVRIVSLFCDTWSDQAQKLVVLRAVINGDTFVWAEDDPYLESGQIQIVGNTEIVKAIGSQICEDPQIYERPAINEIFPPRADWTGWVEADFGRGRLEVEKLREALLEADQFKVSTYVPIEDFRQEELFRLFAVINNNTFLRASMDGYQLLGSRDTVNHVTETLQRKFKKGQFYDWINLDAKGKPTRLDFEGGAAPL